MILKPSFLLLLALCSLTTLQKYSCISSTPANALSSAYDLIPNFQSGKSTLMQEPPLCRTNRHPCAITTTTLRFSFASTTPTISPYVRLPTRSHPKH